MLTKSALALKPALASMEDVEMDWMRQSRLAQPSNNVPPVCLVCEANGVPCKLLTFHHPLISSGGLISHHLKRIEMCKDHPLQLIDFSGIAPNSGGSPERCSSLIVRSPLCRTQRAAHKVTKSGDASPRLESQRPSKF